MTQSLLGFIDLPFGSQFQVPTGDRGQQLYGQAVDPSAVVASSTLFAETKFVAKNGVDATADGSVTKPFLTIQAAITSITDAASNKPYGVIVMPGVYTETFAIAPWIYVQGISPLAVFLNPVTANWISAGFAAGTKDGGISSVTLLTNLTVDFALVGSAGAGTFKLSDCILGSAVALVFKGNNVSNVVNLANLLSIGPTSSPLTLTNITSNAGAVNLRNGVLTITGTDAYTCTHRFESLSTGGTMAITWTGADTTKALSVTFYASPLPLSTTSMTITGAGASVYARGVQQVTGPDADTTFSFGRVPNGGTVIMMSGGDQIILANPTAARTYSFEGVQTNIGTRVRLINQSAFPITIAFAGGASVDAGTPTYVAPFCTLHLLGRGLAWDVEDTIQFGSTTLINGESPFIAADISANSIITATLRAFIGATGTISAPSANRVTGTKAGGGGFILRSVTAAGVTTVADQSGYDWHVKGLGAGT